jgi:hypothetical protein
MTGLAANTTYYYRAFATNEAGTAYGSDLSFATTGLVTVATPTCTPASGFPATVSCTIQSGADGCYTTNSTAPTATTAGTCSNGTRYSGAFAIPSSGTTLEILATESGEMNSAIASYSYSAGVTVTPLCSIVSTSETATCSATGTPIAGSKAVILFGSYGSSPPASNTISCSNSASSNIYTWRGEGGGASTDFVAVEDTTLSSVESGMTFSCTTTQAGASYGTNLIVLQVSNWTTGIDSLAFKVTAASTSAWATPSLTPSAVGDAIISAYLCGGGEEANLSVSTGWTAGTELDPTNIAGTEGPMQVGYRSAYASTTALSDTFTCSGNCTSAPAVTLIVGYK